jgi:HK97 family phage major capsid protein
VNIDDLITSIEAQYEQAKRDRERALSEIKFTIATVNKEGRAGFTKEERERVEQLRDTADKRKNELPEIERKLTDARQVKADEAEVEQLNQQRTQTAVAPKPYDRVARVGTEERTYRADTDRKGQQFLTDVARVFLYRDLESEQRLTAHMREERVERAQYMQRAVGTGAFAGLTVPQYLTDMYAQKVRELRPFADICNKHDLPSDGMTVNISRITTGLSTALQATENSAVSETNMDDTLLTENVQTVAGQQTLSRQAIDRGTGIEDVVMDDLFRSYATTLDNTLITQATTGLSAIATANTYTDASPTAAELWPKIHSAAAGVEAALLGKAVPSHVVMHSRRWYWIQSQVGTSWPFLAQPNVPVQAGGVNLATAYGSGARGILPNGMVAVVDNNIATNLGAGTNEDEIYVVPADECHLWEDAQAPVFIRAEQPAAASLGVLLVLYGYFAYSFRRYSNSHQKISGTGLITPSF